MRKSMIFAGALILLALPASAQTLAMNTANTDEEAAALEAEAKALHDQPKEYRQAAELYLDAASLRAIGDPLHVTDQVMAARLLYYAGEESRAQAVMARAGEDALAAGDVVTAATAMLDAAWIALQREDGRTVLDLAERAELLMASPLVEADVRKAILDRIDRNADRISVRPGSS